MSSPVIVGIARNGINVQLERISAGLLDLPRVIQPAAKCAAVQAADDWDIDRRFRLGDVLEVRFRPNLELGPNRKIAQRLRVRFRALFKIKIQVVVIAPNLLFEKRMKNDRRSACVFHSFDVVDLFRKRRCRWHQRRAQFKAEISGR